MDTEDFKSLKRYFNIKGIFLCDEAIVLLINLHFEAMKWFFRYWNSLKRSVDTFGRSVSVSEARKVGTSPTFGHHPWGSWGARWPMVASQAMGKCGDGQPCCHGLSLAANSSLRTLELWTGQNPTKICEGLSVRRKLFFNVKKLLVDDRDLKPRPRGRKKRC